MLGAAQYQGCTFSPILFILFTDRGHRWGVGQFLVCWFQNLISAFCKWCGSLDFINSWPPAHTEAAGMKQLGERRGNWHMNLCSICIKKDTVPVWCDDETWVWKGSWRFTGPTLSHGHELWVVRERIRLQIQAVGMSFFLRVSEW